VGLAIAGTGEGGLQTLLNTIPPCRLLRLAGAERVALTPPPGVVLEERITYASEPQPCPMRWPGCC
jgi:uroporphyrinogen-III synthase